MTVLSEVELRRLATKYFPGLEDKVLYLINGESGGNPEILGDGGAAFGLFQSHYMKNPDPEAQFQDARRLYDADVANGGTGFGDWGEGRLYQGKPFGALGNHPYPGGTGVSGRAPTGEGITVPIANKPKGTDDQGRWTIPDWGKGAMTGQNPYIPGYQPTGNFDSDVKGYWANAEKAWNELSQYQLSSGDVLIIDEDKGMVFKYKGEGLEGPILEPDLAGSKILQRALSSQDALDRLYAGKQAGLFESGNDAAQAYLAAEKDKASEAARQYQDYTTRIQDIIALEDVPKQRQLSLANALNAANNANSSKASTYGSQMFVKGNQTTDVQPFADAIKSTLPGQAPSPYNINSDALNTGKVPMPMPGASPMPGAPVAGSDVIKYPDVQASSDVALGFMPGPGQNDIGERTVGGPIPGLPNDKAAFTAALNKMLNPYVRN